jgi:hypothetical protein
MSDKVIQIVPKDSLDKKGMLDKIDNLRTMVDSGELIGFAAIGFYDKEGTTLHMFFDSVVPISTTVITGAFSRAMIGQ